MKLPALALTMIALANVSAQTVYIQKLVDIDGRETTLEEHKGKVLLIVNVASRCGFTGQYAGMEKLYREFKDEGLVVCGFPCNQFGGQEPGSEEQILDFCQTRYEVSFPLFAKIDVNGESRHPLYAHLAGTGSRFSGDISWNFEKFLVDKEG